jgi:uncharacterized membrane protein YhaH (DUF805 family)
MSTLPQPIGRAAFFGRFILGVIASVAIYVAFTWALYFAIGRGHENVPVVFLFFGLWLVAFLFLVMCFVRFVIIARLVSIGANRWFALLFLIPLVCQLFLLFLLFCPARRWPNNSLQATAAAPASCD